MTQVVHVCGVYWLLCSTFVGKDRHIKTPQGRETALAQWLERSFPAQLTRVRIPEWTFFFFFNV